MGMDQNKNRSPQPHGGNKGSEVDREAATAMLQSNGGSRSSSGHSSGKKRGRHESTDTEASELSTTLERAPPDGGWGWVVVGAAFLVNLIADGVTFSFGHFFVEFDRSFKESEWTTAWVGSLLAAMPLLSGPIASSLTDRFGCRRVTIIGGLLAAIGFLLSSFAKSIYVLYFTFGVITGFGLSLCYVAAVVIVAYYFENRRSLATGLSVCGGGIGTFIFSPLTQYLIAEYGWRDTTCLFAGAFLNLCVCGVLMKDLEWTKKGNNSKATTNQQKYSLPYSVDMGYNETNAPHKCDRLWNSASCIPTFVQEQERRHHHNHHQFSRHVSNGGGVLPSIDADVTNTTSNHANKDSGKYAQANNVNVKDIASREMLNTGNVTSVTSSPNSNSNNVNHNTASAAQQQIMRNYVVNHTSWSWSGVHRHSLTYRGAVLSLKRYRLRPASSCPDIISVATTEDRESQQEWMGVMGDVRKWFRGVCALEHLSNIRFILFVFSNFLLYMWYDVPYMYLLKAAVQSGFSKDRSSYLISTVGIMNVVGNVVLGYMGDKKWTNAIIVYGVCMVFCGGATLVMPFLMKWNFWGLVVSCGVFGLTIAANYSLTSVILVKVVSIERFANAYGVLLLVQGIGNLVGPPIAGVISDYTGTDTWYFVVAGGGIIASSFFIFAPKFLRPAEADVDKDSSRDSRCV